MKNPQYTVPLATVQRVQKSAHLHITRPRTTVAIIVLLL